MDAEADTTIQFRPDLGKGRAKAVNRPGWTTLRRGIAFSVAAALAGLILTSALPPLVADQTDRAVINAPAMLLTAPITGEVTSLTAKPGTALDAQSGMAAIVNNRIDRSTLITLEGKHTDSLESLQAIRAKKEGDARYINALSDQISKQTTTIEARYQEQITELRAEIGSAEATMGERKLIVDRQTQMVARSVASPEMSKAAMQQFAAAKFEREGTLSKLQQKQAQLDSAREGIFVGDDVHDLATLIQKKRDIELDLQRLGIEEVQLAAAVGDQTELLEAERQRLARLEWSSVDTPGRGEVLNVDASVGRHVNAGDTLARMVDCDASFVVAIFSYRQGSDLSVGARVSIDAGPAGTQGGTVTEVLPKTSDKVDATYAVPFPQTERRELYVLIRPDSPLRRAVASGGPKPCDIGRWVTVTRASGWVPSTSVVWEKAKGALARGVEAVAKNWPAFWTMVARTASQSLDATRHFLSTAGVLIDRDRPQFVGSDG